MRRFKRPKRHQKQCGRTELGLRPNSRNFFNVFCKSVTVGAGVVFHPPPTLPYCHVHFSFFLFYKFTSPDAKRDLEPPACPTKTIEQLRRKASIHALFSIGARNTRPCLSPLPSPHSTPSPIPKTSFSTASAA